MKTAGSQRHQGTQKRFPRVVDGWKIPQYPAKSIFVGGPPQTQSNCLMTMDPRIVSGARGTIAADGGVAAWLNHAQLQNPRLEWKRTFRSTV